jgi:hypothetical protein
MYKDQKFKRGDLVHIAKDLGHSMSHFDNDIDVIILGSYADLCHGDASDIYKYSVLTFNSGSISWYNESQLTFIEHVGEERIREVKDDMDAKRSKS